MMFLQCGYLQNQVAYTNFAIIADDLSKYGSLSGVCLPFWPFLSLAVLMSGRLSTGNLTISNQLVAGSIIVRHMKSIAVPSLPFMVYGPIKSTQRVCHGLVITCLGGNLPYCFCLLLLTLHFLQFLTYALTVRRIPFQYMEPLKVSSSRVDPGCCK
jgi:hypothetical protein